ncbi:hypothetical protein GQ44DRAFT_722805 [Phaeosphaeriaceae sp. PMI808]|nr:hypothetical protein GQ44DRAFT_722805 [Phaeosphaeriaceae sp. PMI808]
MAAELLCKDIPGPYLKWLSDTFLAFGQPEPLILGLSVSSILRLKPNLTEQTKLHILGYNERPRLCMIFEASDQSKNAMSITSGLVKPNQDYAKRVHAEPVNPPSSSPHNGKLISACSFLENYNPSNLHFGSKQHSCIMLQSSSVPPVSAQLTDVRLTP